jgi:ribosomal subunit interface protein
MVIQIAVRHDTTDGRIKKFIETELSKIQEKYSPISAEVVIDHEGHTGLVKTAEFNIKVPGDMVHVKESSADIHTSIEVGIKAVEKQLQKFKEKHLNSAAEKRHAGKPEFGEV